MKEAGQIVLFRFPHADLAEGKLRPALLINKLPGEYDDWLVCMVSSQTQHFVPEFDEIVQVGDPDFVESGLKATSIIRIGRLALLKVEYSLGPSDKYPSKDSPASRAIYQPGCCNELRRRLTSRQTRILAGRVRAPLPRNLEIADYHS